MCVSCEVRTEILLVQSLSGRRCVFCEVQTEILLVQSLSWKYKYNKRLEQLLRRTVFPDKLDLSWTLFPVRYKLKSY
jgi:hypothetical protein